MKKLDTPQEDSAQGRSVTPEPPASPDAIRVLVDLIFASIEAGTDIPS